MTRERDRLEAAIRAAIVACDPAAAVASALKDLRGAIAGRRRIGVAIGKAALAMARGAGSVFSGIAVAPGPIARADRALPHGWRAHESDHPELGDRSLRYGNELMWHVKAVGDRRDVVIALISGGASSLVEIPTRGVTYPAYRARIAELMARGAPIAEINRARTAMSELKGGKLAELARGPVISLIASDVIGDDPRVIGSGPTIRDPAREGDITRVILPMRCFAERVAAELAIPVIDPPIAGDVVAVAARLAQREPPFVAWGEPTLALAPADQRGEGGRAQQLALLLARHFAGAPRAALVFGSDGIDGPPPRTRPSPAGAFVDATTWASIRDPDAALRRNDAGTALAEIGALIVTGPTGSNHADIAIVV